MANFKEIDFNPENMEDLISQLPDAILISIITRIPTKDALVTRTLSKQWSNLFRFVPALKFSCGCRYKCTCHSKAFIDGVYGVLQRHYAFIHSFELRCCLSESYTHIFEQCIYFLGGLGVEKLYLNPAYFLEGMGVAERYLNHAYKELHYSFSCHLLSQMPSLKYFTLRHCSLQPNLKNPCNSLKTLKLSKVKVLPGSLECILSNCLSLCSLTITKCELPSKLYVRGHNLQLKCLAIHECDGLKEIEFYASEFMTLDFCHTRMVIFIFDYVPQLKSIYLYSSFEESMPYVCRRLGKDLPHLKTLILDGVRDPLYHTYELCFKVCFLVFVFSDSQDDNIDMGIDMFKFSNLKRLELFMSPVFNFNLCILTTLLRGCPILEEFYLAAVAQYYDWQDEKRHVVVHSHLKNVELNGFGGYENEIEFALYILKSAVRLEVMNISRCPSFHFGLGECVAALDYPMHSKDLSEIRESIEKMKHHAVSKTAQVIFQPCPRTAPKRSGDRIIF